MRKMLVGIIPNPYTERRCGNGKPKEKYTDEVLRYGRRKAADRREDGAASHKAVWGMCMDQVVETECTQDAADSDEEAHEDKEPVMGGDPEDAPKKYTEKADCTDGNQLCEKWFWHKVPSFNMYEM